MGALSSDAVLEYFCVTLSNPAGERESNRLLWVRYKERARWIKKSINPLGIGCLALLGGRLAAASPAGALFFIKKRTDSPVLSTGFCLRNTSSDPFVPRGRRMYCALSGLRAVSETQRHPGDSKNWCINAPYWSRMAVSATGIEHLPVFYERVQSGIYPPHQRHPIYPRARGARSF